MDSSTALSERDVALAIVKDAANSSTSTTSPRDALSALKLSDIQGRTSTMGILMHNDASSRLSPLAQTDGVHIAIADDPRVPRGPRQPPSISVDNPMTHRDSGGLRLSKSNSGLAHQLSHKLSSTFGNPTIVHRPNLRTRPALLSMHEEAPLEPDLQYDQLPSPPESTAPSSYNASGSVSAGDPSTVRFVRSHQS